MKLKHNERDKDGTYQQFATGIQDICEVFIGNNVVVNLEYFTFIGELKDFNGKLLHIKNEFGEYFIASQHIVAIRLKVTNE